MDARPRSHSTERTSRASTWIRKVHRHIKRLLARLGVKPELRAFIILSEQRTGSNMLHSGLIGHPKIMSFHEVLNKKFRDPGRFSLDKDEQERINRLRLGSPGKFIHDYVFNPARHGCSHIGFKCQYQNLRGTKGGEIVETLNAVEGLVVIHLVRENMLERLVSKKNAELSGKYWLEKGSGDAPRPDPYTITYKEAFSDFKCYESDQKRFESLFQGKTLLRIRYEDLIADYAGTLALIFRALDLKPVPCAPRTVKQSGSARVQVKNYAELRKRFAGSRYEKYFDI